MVQRLNEFSNTDPKRLKEYEHREKATADDRNRMDGAREAGKREAIIEMVRSLLTCGMPLAEISKHTPYSESELEKLLGYK